MNILITGGASGLGEAITRELAKSMDSIVFFTWYNAESNAGALEHEFKNVKGIRCDFKNLEEVITLSQKLNEINPDVLIHNAWSGNFLKNHFHKTNEIEFIESFNTNVVPVILITQSALQHFRKKKRGKIITILTSALSENPPIGSSVYTSSKAMISQLSKAWALENTAYNITANTVSPSFMLTNFTKELDERVIEQIKEKSPGKNLLTVHEVAQKIALICSDSFTENGTDILFNHPANKV